MATMKAAVFVREGCFELREVDIPGILKPDQVLVEVEAVSICGTDVHITAVPPGYEATPGTILGHEMCGTVVKTGGAVTAVAAGDRIVVNPNNYCGVCVYCRKNLPNECLHIEPLGIDFDGAFAKYCVVSERVAHKIDPSVPVEEAACAEPLACAVNGIRKINLIPGESAVIIGCGPIGLMLGMLLKSAGAGKVFMLETSDYRSEFARGLKIGRVINPLREDAAAAVAAETEIGADCVFDVTGSQFKLSVELVRKGGKVVLFGVNKRAVSQLPQSDITTKEIAVLGTWLANATFPEAVSILEQKSIDVSRLITDVLPLDKIHEGIGKLAKGAAVKVIVKP